jgi:hypothetical protein
MKKLIMFFALAISMIFSANAMALSVTTTSNGSILANTILGSGITIVPGSIGYNGAPAASGTFTGGIASGIGIESGIILTSGTASLAEGPNKSGTAGEANGFPGDSSLNSLVPGFSTQDASTLTFDFTTAGGDLFFKYVFASEEYNEFTNSPFNDVFGFFLDGSNIALIPGTTTPVSINNVNGGNPLGTNASNPIFYRNNDLNNGGPFFNVQYDGFTTVFTATRLGLGAGTHTIKLAIADAVDNILDSGVFIQGGTFSDTPTPTSSVPEPTSILLMSSGILGLVTFGNRFKCVTKRQS